MIGYYVHHHGLGHRMRFEAVAARLQSPVIGISSMPPPTGWHGPWRRLDRDDDAATRHTDRGSDPVSPLADLDPTAHGVLHWVPRHDAGLARRAAQLAAWIEHARPAVMVVDVSVEVALLSRLCGIPLVVVAMPGQRTDRAHRLAYDLADALLAPWPEGAHSVGWPEAWLAKLWAVGGISRFDGRDPMASGTPNDRTHGGAGPRRHRVLVLSGAGGPGTPAADIEAARVATRGWDWVERSPASPSLDLWADLCAADVVVTHGGQSSIAEVAAARRPAVVVPQPRPFDEQRATAAAVERLGIAVGLPAWPSDPSAWPRLLERALVRGGHGWDRWSTGRGAADAARVLDALAARLRPREAPVADHTPVRLAHLEQPAGTS